MRCAILACVLAVVPAAGSAGASGLACEAGSVPSGGSYVVCLLNEQSTSKHVEVSNAYETLVYDEHATIDTPAGASACGLAPGTGCVQAGASQRHDEFSYSDTANYPSHRWSVSGSGSGKSTDVSAWTPSVPGIGKLGAAVDQGQWNETYEGEYDGGPTSGSFRDQTTSATVDAGPVGAVFYQDSYNGTSTSNGHTTNFSSKDTSAGVDEPFGFIGLVQGDQGSGCGELVYLGPGSSPVLPCVVEIPTLPEIPDLPPPP